MTSEGWRYHPPLNSTMTRREMWESIAFIRAVANGNAETGAPANYRIGARPIDPDQRFVNPNP
jgi:hypothetical protein